MSPKFLGFFFSMVLPYISLLPLVILLLLSFFLLFETLLPLTVLSLLSLLLLAAVFVFFIEASQTQWYVSINIANIESASTFSFQIHISSRFVFIVVFTSHACPKVSVNLFEPLPAASFTCTPVVSMVSLCCRENVTTRSISFFPASLSHLSTAHSRCDEFFDCHVSICSSFSDSMSWYLIYLRDPL